MGCRVQAALPRSRPAGTGTSQPNEPLTKHRDSPENSTQPFRKPQNLLKTYHIRRYFPVPAWTIGLVVACGAIAPTPALSDALVPPDPWQVIHAVRKLGPADVGRDAFRDPEITANLNGSDGAPLNLPYRLTFHGCDLGRDCKSILLSVRLEQARWQKRPPKQALLADWNAQKLLGRAWMDDRNRVILDHAVIMGQGMAPGALSATLKAWALAMLEFAEHVDFKQE